MSTLRNNEPAVPCPSCGRLADFTNPETNECEHCTTEEEVMMPQDTLDVASLLADGLDQPVEIMASEPRRMAGLVPEASLFVVITVEGKRFRVTVTREPE